jgi:glycosyltransferase involved in cell wall biosynthesis/SAM-dependent methyltransferase
MNDVCVTIRTKNEAPHIQEVLEQVLRQRDISFEVVVVDSGSTDETLDIVSKFPVKLIRIDAKDFSYGKALNLGYSAVESKFCVALSAHALPLDRHWLKNILSPFEDDQVCGVVGKQIPKEDCNPFDARGLKRIYGTQKLYLSRDSRITFSNANAAVRRIDWEGNPFDEDLNYSEDLHWSYDMLRRGRRIVYEPTAVVFHSHNESPRQLFDRFYNESNARTVLGYDGNRYGVARLFWDAGAGTVYDLATAMRPRQRMKWTFYAPIRRTAINFGRYCGSRLLPKNPRIGPARQILLRMGLMFLEKTNRSLQGIAPFLVKATRKHISAVHPKHLLKDDGTHYWYGEYLAKENTVLDVGCNQGMHTIFASQFVESVIGMDVDKQAVYVADFNSKWERRRNVRFLLADAQRTLPFRDSVFDAVIAFDIIEHLENRKEFLDQIKRVLKPDGVLLLSAPNSQTGFKAMKRLAGLPTFSDPTHVVEYRSEELEKECLRSGFEIRSLSPITLDSPFYGIIDFLGSISLSLYSRLNQSKRRAVKNRPADSTGFRLVLRPASNNND